MFKHMKIKSQVIAVIALILSIVITLQIFLYILLQSQNKKSITTIYNSISDNVETQINSLHYDIAEICSLLSTHSNMQDFLFKFSAPERVRSINRIDEIISDYRARNQNIACLAIAKDYKFFLSSESNNFYLELDALIKKYLNPSNIQKMFVPSFKVDDKIYFAYILPIYPTDVNFATPEHRGNYIICIYEMKSIGYTPYSFIDGDKINMVITDNNNTVLLSSDVSQHGQPLSDSAIKKNYFSKTFSLSEPDWNVTVFAPLEDVMSLSNVSRLFVILMVFFNIIMLLLLMKLLNGVFVDRLIMLKKSITNIPDDFTNHQISYKHHDEFSEIVDVINQFTHKIGSLNKEKLDTLDKLYNAELLQKETQILYLYGQMSPHFLYNSMFCIQGMALKHNATDIVEVTSSLSKVFRYFSNNLSVSTIRKDISFAVEYFKILNMRRHSPVDIHMNIDESLENVRCLKMIYQPILENVLKHAFLPDESGLVTISSVPDEKFAIIEITDNGKGFEPAVLENLLREMESNNLKDIQNSNHVGLINVHMRLKLHYGETCGLRISSTPGNGTTVRVLIEKDSRKLETFSFENA
ncbi:MAG: histidine kinase [Clostridia bacterium]|nr:histidine kinase [Clostridia bacterium]